MPDVVVDRCTLRVVRRGGWSWGAAPRELLEQAMRALPALLDAELQGLEGVEAGDVVIEGPVRLYVPLRRSELEARGGAALAEALAGRLAPTVRAAVAAAAPAAAPRSTAAGTLADAAAPAPAQAAAVAPPSVPELLARWAAAGRLERLLALLAPQALAGWDRWAFAGAAAPVPPGDAELAAVRRLAASILAPAPPETTAAAVLRARLRLAAAAAARPETATPSALAELARLLPPPEPPAPELPAAPSPSRPGPAVPPAAVAGAASTERETIRPSDRTARGAKARPRGAFVVPALPFLALAVLARLGYVEAAEAAVAAEGAQPHAFGQALAAKLLDPPDRGWRRGPREQDALAAVAPDADLATLARAAALFAPALDALVAALLLEERPARPLVVEAVGAELALVDPTGWSVVALADDAAAVAAVLETAGRPPVRAGAAVDPHELRRVGIQVPRAARPAPAGRTTELLAALAARPAVPRTPEPALERTLGLAAALALGSIAWTLWPDDERTDPLLALERFGDLDARVAAEPQRLSLRLPLGRRYLDLEAHGLLRDVPATALLGGRRIEFGRG